MYAASVHNVNMNAEYLFEVLGGVRPGAAFLAVPPSTASSWKKRGVPGKRIAEIVSTLERSEIEFDRHKLGVRWVSDTSAS